MNKKVKVIAILLIVANMMVGMIFPASAAKSIWKYMGDADLDGTVTIVDATAIQRCLAGMRVFNRLQTIIADVNGNHEVDILDATVIQRELAQLDSGLRDENDDRLFATIQIFNYEVCDMTINVSFEGDCVKVGEPVTFTAAASTQESLLPLSFEYRIHECKDENTTEKVIRPRSNDPECVYTFDQAGEYLVDVYAYNTADSWMMYTKSIFVYED